MLKRHASKPRRMRLTALEKKMLHRAAELVLAVEWPWGDENMAREYVALQRASNKLKDYSDEQ